MMLTLKCLGDFQAIWEGQPIAFVIHTARALLAYLAMNADQAHSREKLSALFWPDQNQATAFANLRSTLARLRKALPEQSDALLVNQQSIQFRQQAAQIDVHDFEKLLAACEQHAHANPMQCVECAQRMTQAAALYSGELLQNLSLHTSQPFEEWLLLKREQLRRQVVNLLETLSAHHEWRGDYEALCQTAYRQLALEPWHEPAHRSLMRGLALCGKRNAALAQYQICQQVLAAELGIEPDAETNALYEQIRSGNFRLTIDDFRLTQIVNRQSSIENHLDWGEMPAVDIFHGRSAELLQLQAWLVQDRCRLVSVLGMGGIGKTTLAAAAAQAAAPDFEFVIWRSLLNAPMLDDILSGWLQTLSQHALALLPESLDERLRLLLDHLRQHRCLLVLDNVESILQASSADRPHAGEVRPGYEGYALLFERLAASEHRSCALLTSREQPYALARIGREVPTVRRLPLAGLDEQAGVAILQGNGLTASTQDAALLVQSYSGNPLALQIVANTITDFFAGDIAAFRREDGLVFDGIRAVLDQQFMRLSDLEREILFWLAIEREAVSVQTLRANFIEPVNTSALLGALNALQARALLERSGDGLTLQNVIIEYTTEQLVTQVCNELMAWAINDDRDGGIGLPIQPSFLNRFALVKAQTKEYVRQSQARMILQPIATRVAARIPASWVDVGLRTQVQRMLDSLRGEGRPPGYGPPGYAAGNLLIHFDVDLTGYDFSQLSVWQADLRGLTGAALNLARADLSRSAFTLSFHAEAIQFQPDGALMVAGNVEGDFALWRVVAGQFVGALRDPSDSSAKMCFSADGRWAAGVGYDHVIRIWSTASGACVHTLRGHTGPIYSLALSPDGALLASGTADRPVYVWDVFTGQVLHELDGHERGVGALGFSADGAWLASGGSDFTVRMWAVHALDQPDRLYKTLSGHTREIGAVAFSPDGTLLASGDHGGGMCVWRLNDAGHEADCRVFEHTPHNIVRTLCFHPDGQRLASGSADQTVRLWSLAGQLLHTQTSHVHEVEALAFSADGSVLASSGYDQNICLYDAHTLRLLNMLRAYQPEIDYARFSPDGQLLAGGSDDRITLWQIAYPDVRSTLSSAPPVPIAHVLHRRGHAVHAVAFNPNGRDLVSGGADQCVRVWNIATGQEMHALAGHNGRISTMAWSSDGRWLALTGGDDTIRIWAMAMRDERPHDDAYAQLHRTLDDATTGMSRLVFGFGPDANRLFGSSIEGTVRVWDVSNGALLRVLVQRAGAIADMALSRDGRVVAILTWGRWLRVYDSATGECIAARQTAEVGDSAIAFSPDSEVLAYSGLDFAIHLWRWRTPEMPRALLGHTNKVLTMDWHPAAPLLVSGSMDGTLRVWDLETNRCCQVLRPASPYTGMNITGVTGISDAQKAALQALGAIRS